MNEEKTPVFLGDEVDTPEVVDGKVTVPIDLDEETFDKVQKIAQAKGLTPEEVIENTLEDIAETYRELQAKNPDRKVSLDEVITNAIRRRQNV